jgi:mitochondrial FAD-linked sulfhydryl oxidase
MTATQRTLPTAHTACTPIDSSPGVRSVCVRCLQSRPYAYMHSGCPLNRREIGRATWAFLHTTAAYYPDRPSADDAARMDGLVRSVARFFPCGYCADKTEEEIARNPPRTRSQAELAVWLCTLHNEVNERMNKPPFPCTPEHLRARWKSGPADGSCG